MGSSSIPMTSRAAPAMRTCLWPKLSTVLADMSGNRRRSPSTLSARRLREGEGISRIPGAGSLASELRARCDNVLGEDTHLLAGRRRGTGVAVGRGGAEDDPLVPVATRRPHRPLPVHGRPGGVVGPDVVRDLVTGQPAAEIDTVVGDDVVVVEPIAVVDTVRGEREQVTG